MKTLQLIAISLLAAGCATNVPCEKPAIAAPQMPSLPHIEPTELKCLSDITFSNLVDRELRLKEHSERCIVIIKGLTSER